MSSVTHSSDPTAYAIGFECPNCTSAMSVPYVPEKPVLHKCKGLGGLMAPMIRAGVKAKVEAIPREDYEGPNSIAQRDENGKVVMAIETTRDDGNDVAVLVPTAFISRQEILDQMEEMGLPLEETIATLDRYLKGQG